ncbi:hypothetical protein AYL99_04120 [Fonsecaea erecta]|uniref:BTB domain-containing protein n=1 Tax=Fonsecaea erecta TaxID=1367422 RepID=A0A178ZQ52_9EURO|nr:hypothetical protein AYL99_04120 [Fonsecaea erecta]OAP61917.1 hypothetical protein AYL99_04120 [Fonsecaea erecta]
MAPTTPGSKSGGKYANPTIQIVVGRTKRTQQLFHVHYAFLEKTDFFSVHGPPPLPTATATAPTPTRGWVSMNSPAATENAATPEPDEVKVEQDIEDQTAETGEYSGASPTATGGAANAPAYNLQGLIYEPAAFEVVVNFLYNEPPLPPSSSTEYRILMKAYILALQYRMPGLQDDLIDCFRNFHKEHRIRFADLFWISGRIGDGEAVCEVPLIQYFVHQIAFEIFQGGYDSFVQRNDDFERFLTQGDRPLRKRLFRAIAQVAQVKKPEDPALGPNRWRVVDYPTFERSADTTTSQTADIIELD